MGLPFYVDTKTISAERLPTSKTFSVRNINNNPPSTQLREIERAKIFKKVILDAGYAEDLQKPMYTIDVFYGISDPKTKIASQPVFGQTGVSSSSTYGSVNTYGSVSSYGNYNSSSSYNSNTYYTPSFGIVGSSTYSYDEYTRFLVFKAYDPNGKELFETASTSSGSTGDIDIVLPLLAYKIIPYFGKSMKGTSQDVVYEQDRKFKKWVEELDNFMNEPSPQVSGFKKQLDPPSNNNFDKQKGDLLQAYRNGTITKDEYFQKYKQLRKKYPLD